MRSRLPSTPPEKFNNADLFILLGLPSTLIRHENGSLAPLLLSTDTFAFENAFFLMRSRLPFTLRWRNLKMQLYFYC